MSLFRGQIGRPPSVAATRDRKGLRLLILVLMHVITDFRRVKSFLVIVKIRII